MSETPAAPVQPAGGEPTETPRARLVESVLDNLPVWTVVAAAIGLLYLVWVTIEILTHYVGDLPKVSP